jgi:hypothetical protein
MPAPDKRNVLTIGSALRPGAVEITPAMVAAVRAIITDAGGSLAVWAVLREDVYETQFGDGLYLHLRGVALNEAQAQRLAALAGQSKWQTWHVRCYQLGLDDDALPCRRAPWQPEEEFTIGQLVAILCEIQPGATVSKLHTGSLRRQDGPLLSLPET